MSRIINTIGLVYEQIDKSDEWTSLFASAMTLYGIIKQYKAGDGVKRDEQKVFQIYRLSLRFGGIQPKILLGRCCKIGIGTDVDMGLAIHLYEKTTMQENNKAAESLLKIMRPNQLLQL